MSATISVEQAAAFEEKQEDNAANKDSYIKVPPVIVTMYHRGRPKGNMTISLLIKIVDSEKHANAVKYMPRLSSAYVMEASRLSHDYFDVKRPVNVAMLGDAFQTVTDHVLGHRDSRIFVSDVIVNKK